MNTAALERSAAAIDELRVTRADTLPADEELQPIAIATDEGKPRKQSDILVEIARRHHLFHDADVAYARMRIGTHHEVHAVESTAYRELLAHDYYGLVGKGCNRNALTDALTTISAQAKFDGPQEKVWLRVAQDGDTITIDMGDADWRAIKVTRAGWSIETTTELRFQRTGKMQVLPVPTKPDFTLLWRYANVRPEDRVLVAAFLLAALRPSGPYPLLILSGEQGAGKSTFAKLIKRLADPSAAGLRPPPKDSRDLLVGARNAWLVCIDNLSYLPAELSDALCRIATGGAIAERTLYTNTEETLIEIRRPLVINGIEELATRPDLAERGIHIELAPVVQRRAEREFWQSFERDAPAILAALLDALSLALRDLGKQRCDHLPRMADFAQWAIAGLPGLDFTAEEFLDAYAANQRKGMELGLEASPVGAAIEAFTRTCGEWTGSANALLRELSELVGEQTARSRSWPRSAKALHGHLKRLAPALRLAGISVERDRSSTARTVTLCNVGNKASQVSQASRVPPILVPADDDRTVESDKTAALARLSDSSNPRSVTRRTARTLAANTYDTCDASSCAMHDAFDHDELEERF